MGARTTQGIVKTMPSGHDPNQSKTSLIRLLERKVDGKN